MISYIQDYTNMIHISERLSSLYLYYKTLPGLGVTRFISRDHVTALSRVRPLNFWFSTSHLIQPRVDSLHNGRVNIPHESPISNHEISLRS